ncbi:MAG TPA: hypothetical protein VFR81_17895 [Longimicrobium sp.]|nr:hypothetical protein [Longimicrobium sp.]
MPTPERRVSTRTLRETAARAVEATSLRGVARLVGLSAMGLRDFIRGQKEPRGSTLRKVERWYFAHGAPYRAAIDEETVRAAFSAVLAPVAEKSRDRRLAQLLEALAGIYRDEGIPLPPWMRGGGEESE